MKFLLTLVLLWLEICAINVMVRDPYGWFEGDDNFGKIEARMESSEIGRHQCRAEKLQMFAGMWLVIAIAKFVLFFRSAPVSMACAVPLFVYACELEEGAFGDALRAGVIAFLVTAVLMGSFYSGCWHMVGEES